MDDMIPELSFRITIDPSVTPTELDELVTELERTIEEWCCVLEPGDEEMTHRATLVSHLIAYIDPA